MKRVSRKSKEKIKLAIIGCGGMAGGHLRACKELKEKKLDNFDLVATCDVSEERALRFADTAEQFQNGLRPKVFFDHQELLKKEKIEAALIPSHHRSHHIIGLDCLLSGAHVMTEKPFAITIKAARKMIETAKSMKKIAAVAENYRYDISNRAIKFAIEGGLIGKPQMLFQGGVGGQLNAGLASTSWRHHKLEAGDGTILDNGVHDSDLFYYFLGEVDEVYGVAFRFDDIRYRRDNTGKVIETTYNDCNEGGFAILKFANGVVGQWAPAYWAGHGEGAGYGRWIYGSKGVLKGDTIVKEDGAKESAKEFFDRHANEELKEKYFPFGLTNSVTLEVYGFLSCIQNGGTPETDGEVGLKALAIAYSLIESSCLKAPVKVKDVESGKIEIWQKEINESLGL
jgi:predicted dehydrogenase